MAISFIEDHDKKKMRNVNATVLKCRRPRMISLYIWILSVLAVSQGFESSQYCRICAASAAPEEDVVYQTFVTGVGAHRPGFCP